MRSSKRPHQLSTWAPVVIPQWAGTAGVPVMAASQFRCSNALKSCWRCATVQRVKMPEKGANKFSSPINLLICKTNPINKHIQSTNTLNYTALLGRVGREPTATGSVEPSPFLSLVNLDFLTSGVHGPHYQEATGRACHWHPSQPITSLPPGAGPAPWDNWRQEVGHRWMKIPRVEVTPHKSKYFVWFDAKNVSYLIYMYI